MARPLRIEFEDALYHVTARGDRREAIFHGEIDRQVLLRIVGQSMARFDAVAHAYCLMPNHYHLVLRTYQPNLSRLMRHINGVYTQAYRDTAIVMAYLQGGYTQTAIAEATRLSVSRISRLIAACEAKGKT